MLETEEIKIQDKVSTDYERIRYAKHYSKIYQQSISRFMISLINQNGLILDSGCGTGNIIELLPKRNVIGIDISKGMLIKAIKRMDFVVNADCQKLPFKDDVFNTILCKGLLHHLSNPEKAISEMYRVLKKNGEIVIAETNLSFISYIPRRLIKKSGHFSSAHKNFLKKEIINIIIKKFHIEEVKHLGYIAHPLIGFPDIIDIFRYVPSKFEKQLTSFLINIDQLIARIPLINTQSWSIIIKASKREEEISLLSSV